jgi:DNA-binding SARP family transcriptional activator
MDAEDRDPGLLVAGLGSVWATGHSAKTSPRLLPLPETAWRKEAMRLFAALLEEHGTSRNLVIDNFQAAEDSPSFVAIVAGLMDAWRSRQSGARLIVTSRRRPPRLFGRLIVEGAIDLVDPSVLALSKDEAESLLHLLVGDESESPIDASRVERILVDSGGWTVAAAMLARYDAPRSSRGFRGRVAERTLGDYLSTGILDLLSPAARAALGALAFLPRIEAEHVRSLFEDVEFDDLVDEVGKLGIPHDVDKQGALRLHDIVRALLCEEFVGSCSAGPGAEHAIPLLDLLAREGRLQDAGTLASTLGLHDRLADLIKEHAGALHAEGRSASVEAALAQLPPSRLAEDPWLGFWSACCVLPRDAAAARHTLVGIFESFEQRGDATFARLAAAGIALAVTIEGSDFTAALRWVDYLERSPVAPLPPVLEGHVRAVRLRALFMAEVCSARAQKAADEAILLLDAGIRLADAVTICGTAAVVYHYAGRPQDAQRFAERGQDLVQHAVYDPFAQISFGLDMSLYLLHTGRLAELRRLAEETIRLMESSGLRLWGDNHAAFGIAASLGLGDAAGIDWFNASCRHGSSPLTPPFQRASDHYRAAVEHFVHGRVACALDELFYMNEQWEKCSFPFSRAVPALTAVTMLAMRGDIEGARGYLQRAAASIRDLDSPIFDRELLFLETLVAVKASGPEGARAQLERLVAGENPSSFGVTMLIWRDALSSIVGALLDLGIDRPLALEVARIRNLTPPLDDVGPVWPWPFVVRTLGVFEQTGSNLDDVPVKQRGPMALLKVLIATRSGSMTLSRLTREMWAGRSPASSRSALDTAIHRLRRHFDDDAIIRIAGNSVSLDRRRLWTDAWAFEQVCESIEPMTLASSRDTLHLSERLLDLYRGPFCDGDDQLSLVRARARFARAFEGAVSKLASLMRAASNWDRATWLLESALERDETSEIIHRALIEVWIERGYNGEALRAFDRCRTALRAHLRAEPSDATVRLVQTLRAVG